MMEFLKEKKNFVEAISFFLFVLSVFFVFKIVGEIKTLRLSGGEAGVSTISVSGKGEVFAVPDIANIIFTVNKKGKNVADAQKPVSEIIDSILLMLEQNQIEDRDIKTISYNSFPEYEYRSNSVTCTTYSCPPRNQELVGYSVSQTISIKVRDTEKVSKILEQLATLGATEINGPSFEVDDEDELMAIARRQAIDDAKNKAKVLAKDLDIKLVRIIGFSDNYGEYYPYGKSYMESAVSVDAGSLPSPRLPEGENRISSSVDIVYQIK